MTALVAGLIAGGAIAGVAQSIIAFLENESVFDLSDHLGDLAHNQSWWPMLFFVAMALDLGRVAWTRPPTASAPSRA